MMTLMIQLMHTLDVAQIAKKMLALVVSPPVYHTTQLTSLTLPNQELTTNNNTAFCLVNHISILGPRLA
ncbi:hypothetical protein Q4519_05430 [Motilimonas sp. 1_MG-2023]|uniref:hypothetical protein n=1 Tax=Motilimonas sp. 1_MG-2023 TaxID=3062672 RepID=UPI0026E37C79|nr:hypothetical protein [Motilimonas sp. 1_MG-2023]MDO6525119.1 hypothetical protein [Motilimonas sp. 1_MG-2023]